MITCRSQKWVSMDGLEEMPIWCPPTPPQDCTDVYMDYSLAHLYETQIMDESSLPPVYVPKELKRTRKESVHVPPDDGRRPAKIRKEETVYAPRSLFDRPSPALVKLRRDLKLQKFRGIVRPLVPMSLGMKASPLHSVRPIEEPDTTPEWLVHEDWILLQAVQNLLELPLNLVILTPAHTPNWDLVSDMVNSYSRSYRSPKQCRNRYIGVILPREEGKASVETSPKKLKKTKALVRSGQQPLISVKPGSRPMRTSQIFSADNNLSFSTVWHQKFETLKSIFQKKAPTNRSMLSGGSATSNRSATNVKHAGVLQEAGIAYDTPLNPVQVAAIRAERIAQKQRTAAAMAEQAQVQQRLANATAVSASSNVVSASTVTSGSQTNAAARVATVASPSPLSVNPISIGSNVQTTGSAIGQHTLLVQQNLTQSALAVTATQQQSIAPIRAQRPAGTVNIQELAVAAGSSPIRSQVQTAGGTTSPPAISGQTVVTVGNLTPVQVQAAAQMLASAGIAVTGTGQFNTITTTAAGVKGASVTVVQTSGTTVASPATAATKALTPTQLQFIRQQALAKQHQQRLQEQQLKKIQLTTGACASSSASSTPQLVTVAGTTTVAQKVPLVTAVGTTLPGTTSTLSTFNTVQIAGPNQGTRTQLLKSGAALIGKGGTTVARAIVTETEMAALLKRQQQLQQQQQQQKVAGVTATGGQQTAVQIGGTGSNTAGITTAQLLAQAGFQVQVKGLAAGVKATAATPQQLKQLTIQHQLLQQRKAQQQQPNKAVTLGTVKGNVVSVPSQPLSTAVGTVQIVQPVGAGSASGGTVGTGGTGVVTNASKPGAMSTVTMQQLQQVIRQVTAGNAQVLVSSPSSGASGTGMLTKTTAQGQTVQARVIPVTQQGIKQTIQMVTTGQPGSAVGTTRVATLGASATGSIMAPSLASALAAGTWKVAGGTDAQQKALLSQVSAALQSGQPVSLAVRTGPNTSGGPTRILTTGTTFTTVAVTSATTVSIATTSASTATSPSKVATIATPIATPTAPTIALPVAATADTTEPSTSTDN